MKKILTGILIVAIVIGGVMLLKNRKATLALAKPAPVLPASVTTMVLQSGPVTLTLPAMGVVASDASTLLSTRVTGRILSVLRKEGDRVKTGEVLARIDVTDLSAKKQGLHLQQQGIDFQIAAKQEEIHALETSLANAREIHARTGELMRVKGASIEQFRQEESDIARIQASLSAAQNSIASLKKSRETLGSGIQEIESVMAYATVTTPIDGTIGQILARPGDLTTPGKPLFKIASAGGLYLNLSLPDTVKASAIVIDNQTIPLTSKNQAGATGLAQYVAPIPQELNRYVEGQYINLSVVLHQADAVLVPVDGLLTVSGSSSVFVLDATGKAERKPVQILARGIEGVVVSENLAGQKIILAKPDILLRVSAGVPVIDIADIAG